MALDLQTVAAVPEIIPLTGGGKAGLPEMLCVFRDDLALVGSSVGDTVRLDLTLPLPQNWCWQLGILLMSIYDTSAAPEYDEGILEMSYTPTPAAPVETLLSFELGVLGTVAMTGFNIRRIYPYGIAYASWDRVFIDGGNTSPIIRLGAAADTDISTTSVLQYVVGFLGFDVREREMSYMWRKQPIMAG